MRIVGRGHGPGLFAAALLLAGAGCSTDSQTAALNRERAENQADAEAPAKVRETTWAGLQDTFQRLHGRVVLVDYWMDY